ncbi:hypothetical protein H4219_005905 [Mycoemilia scoparia]|uniref:Uncharacterized protein n=1 Tax=Mycoemilia scoparia TaxID=417184 RepID=A0A9W7ZKV1_9FUNG|nr:hypothetical protein H4219_005905 [Mycoemilia scoparia]
MMPSEMPFAEVFFSIDVEASVMPSEDPNAAPPNAGSGLAGLFLPPLTPEQHAILDPAFNALRAIQNLNVTDPQTYQRVLDQLPNLYTSVQGIMGTPNADIIARGIVYEALFALYNIENRSAPLVGSNELNDNFSALSDVPVSSSESSESSELSESASSSA